MVINLDEQKEYQTNTLVLLQLKSFFQWYSSADGYSIFTCIHHSMGMANRCLGDHGQSPMACTWAKRWKWWVKKRWICRLGEDVLKKRRILELWLESVWWFEVQFIHDLHFMKDENCKLNSVRKTAEDLLSWIIPRNHKNSLLLVSVLFLRCYHGSLVSFGLQVLVDEKTTQYPISKNGR